MFSCASAHVARDARGRPSVCVVLNITARALVPNVNGCVLVLKHKYAHMHVSF